MTATWRILQGDCRTRLAELGPGSVQTCVTSPPYFGLRDYGTAGQLGLESTPDEYVAGLVAVFREVRRVLRDDGTVWLNLGDSYSGAPVGSFNGGGFKDKSAQTGGRDLSGHAQAGPANKANLPGIKPKDLLGIPWMVAFALRNDGWYLRSDIIWAKPNPMPESVTDRPTKAHEYLFLLSKGPRYFYDAAAIREADSGAHGPKIGVGALDGPSRSNAKEPSLWVPSDGRNCRSVWTVATQPYPGAHFATFPAKLIEPCILAGSPAGGTVLDPFAGAGTTGLVALRHNRSFVGVELNPAYVQLARDRIIADSPLLNTYAEAAA